MNRKAIIGEVTRTPLEPKKRSGNGKERKDPVSDNHVEDPSNFAKKLTAETAEDHPENRR